MADAQAPPVFIVNPRSANGATLRRFERLRPMLKRELGPIEVRITERPGHATDLAREALDAGADSVIAVGGDGTTNEVVNGFFDDDGAPVSPDAALGVLTSGTGGDFRRTFDWSTEDTVAVARLKERNISRVDVGRATFTRPDGKEASRFFINVASFGLSGAVDDVVNRSSKALGGRASFAIGTVRAFATFKAPRVKLTVGDGPTEERRMSLVAIGNGRYFGGGMMITPEANPSDGVFDVVVVDDAGRRFWVMNAPKVYSGTHIGLPQVHSARATAVTAVPGDPNVPVLIDIDGEQPGQLPARFEIRPAAIALIV